MITSAQITAPPISGSYVEKVYDAPISTENWTWVKLEINQFETLYGQFKGLPIQVMLSEHIPYFYVLTDSLLYEICRENPSHYNARDYYDAGRSIRNITITPSGQLLLSDDYELFKVATPLCKIEGELSAALVEIENIVHIDNIEFKVWHNEKLHIQANYFATSESVELYFDEMTNKVYKQQKR
ncbi:MAG: hypothetical protein ABS882_01620 [Lysinibacillus sp.]